MKIVILLFVIAACATITIWWLGSQSPVRHHVAVMSISQQTPEAIFDTISDVISGPQWRKDVKAVAFLPPAQDGQPRFRETGANGVITYRIEAAERPKRFVTRIDDRSLPFGGSWVFTIIEDGSGSRIRLVEDGEVHPILFRFFARYVFGYHHTLEAYLTALAEKFGEVATIRRLQP